MKRVGVAMIIIMVFIICFAIVIGLVQNVKSEQQNKTPIAQHANITWTDQLNDYYDDIQKISIKEDNVTCYVFHTYRGGGISCLKEV